MRWSVAALLILAGILSSGVSRAQTNSGQVGGGVGCPPYCAQITQSFSDGSVSYVYTPIPAPPNSYSEGYSVSVGNGSVKIAALYCGTGGGLAACENPGAWLSEYGEQATVAISTGQGNPPTLVMNNTDGSLSTTASFTPNTPGVYLFVGTAPGAETYVGRIGTQQTTFNYTGAGSTYFQVATSSSATFNERSGEVYAYLYDAAATPTLPEWAAIILGASLLGIAFHFQKRLSLDRYG
jgi:hypothetical protein